MSDATRDARAWRRRFGENGPVPIAELRQWLDDGYEAVTLERQDLEALLSSLDEARELVREATRHYDPCSNQCVHPSMSAAVEKWGESL